MNAYKMIVTDLDNTLLRSDQTISGYTLSILRRCGEKDIKIVFATNRSYTRVCPYLDLTPCDAVICHGGAAIYDGQKRISDLAIPAGTAMTVLKNLNDYYPHMPLIAESNEVFYANIDVSAIWKNMNSIKTNFTELPGKPVEKIYAGIDCDETMEKVRSFLPTCMNLQKLNENFICIMNKDANKLNALKILIENYDIDMSEILCFGDDFSDIDMIKASGKGVAVANAREEVKASADETAAGNDEDGVAHFIEELLLDHTYSNFKKERAD